MNHLCASGPNAGHAHDWLIPPYEAQPDADYSKPPVERGRCRHCKVERVFTNAPRKGTNWGSLPFAQRGAAARLRAQEL